MRQEEFWTERTVSGPDGETYKLETGLRGEASIGLNPYIVNISVNSSPDSWNLGSEDVYTPDYYAQPKRLDSDDPLRPGAQGRGIHAVSPGESDEMRVTVPVGWFRIANKNAMQSRLSEDRRLTVVEFSIPNQRPVEVAVGILEGERTADSVSRLKYLLNDYQREYSCSTRRAYETWLYDVALVLSDEDWSSLVSRLNTDYSDLDVVASNQTSLADISDVGDRVRPVNMLDDGWKVAGYSGLTGYGSESETDSVSTRTVEYTRDPSFRDRVLEHYGTSCAVCGVTRETPDGRPEVEAAHLEPHSDDQNDSVTNGLPLCKLHHWAFDNGWLSLSDDYTILVRDAPGVEGYDEFSELSGDSLKLPDDSPKPSLESVREHRELHGF